MAWTSDDLATIDAAIAQGVQEVRYADRTVIYRSVTELLKAREVLATHLAHAGTPPTRQYRAYTTKGWD